MSISREGGDSWESGSGVWSLLGLRSVVSTSSFLSCIIILLCVFL